MNDKPIGWLSRDWGRRVGVTGLTCLATLGLLSAFYDLTRTQLTITEIFLVRQDLLPALLAAGLFALIALPFVRFGPRMVSRLERVSERGGVWICLAAALLVAVGVFAGWRLIYQSYPLSMDEFWAAFDTRIFAHGRLLAPIAPPWRPFADALEPMWRLQIPGSPSWASTYLPLNAAFRALFGLVGSPNFAGPFWAGLSVILVYALARRIWPERKDAAVVATILLATSCQLIVTAMSPYAMTPHLALNLLWLWLFLDTRWRIQWASVAVAFAATGLHQFIFHPLFAAPFVLQLWLQRRWRLAAFQTAAYGCICLFWIAYPALMLASQGVSAEGIRMALAHGATAHALSQAFSPVALDIMAENLLRFTVWQNPLTLPLALVGARFAFKNRDGPLAPLAAGVILTTVFMTAITPFQGHGWGYRYLHGFLGSVCLVAACAWVNLSAGEAAGARSRAWAALTAATVMALGVWLPLRLHQVFDFIGPYAHAMSAIEAARAEVVIVDPAGILYGDDLVRNDPDLVQGPKVMHRLVLTPAQIGYLCSHDTVAWFDRTDAAALGLPTSALLHPKSPAEPTGPTPPLVCGAHVVAR